MVFVQNAINGDHLATIDADPHDSVAAVKTKIKDLSATMSGGRSCSKTRSCLRMA